MEFKFDKETMKKTGKTAWRITKAVGIAGVKGIVIDTFTRAVGSSFSGNAVPVKEIFTLDYVIGEEKPKEPKKKWFGKKEKKAEELIEEVTATAVENTLEEAKVEILDTDGKKVK